MSLYYQPLNILQAEILVGGFEAQLPCSAEGINIPERLHNKHGVTSCHLEPPVFTSASDKCDSMTFGKKVKAVGLHRC